MQIIDLSVSVNRLDSCSLKRIEHFFSLFTKTYVRINIKYYVDNLSLISKNDLSTLFDLEKRMGDYNDARFTSTIVIKDCDLNKSWVSLFNKWEIPLDIYVESTDNSNILKTIKTKTTLILKVANNGIVDLYQQFKQYGHTLEFIDSGDSCSSLLTEKDGFALYQRLFENWINDKDGVLVKNFENMVSTVLGGSLKECYVDSCLGKRFHLFEDGTLSICHRSNIEKCDFGNIDDLAVLNDVYEGDKFYDLVEKSLAKRKSCSSCKHALSCQSGCLLDSLKVCGDISKVSPLYCENYKNFFNLVKEYVNEMSNKRISLDQLNPSFKDILINSLKIDIRL